jgi:hypothetical protein
LGFANDDAEEVVQQEAASVLNLTLIRPLVLFIGMRQPPVLRQISEILKDAKKKSKHLLLDECDEARCTVATKVLDLQVYTLDVKASDSNFHFFVDVGGIAGSKVASDLPKQRCVEITVDSVWTPEAYVSEGLLPGSFFCEALPVFA